MQQYFNDALVNKGRVNELILQGVVHGKDGADA